METECSVWGSFGSKMSTSRFRFDMAVEIETTSVYQDSLVTKWAIWWVFRCQWKKLKSTFLKVWAREKQNRFAKQWKVLVLELLEQYLYNEKSLLYWRRWSFWYSTIKMLFSQLERPSNEEKRYKQQIMEMDAFRRYLKNAGKHAMNFRNAR